MKVSTSIFDPAAGKTEARCAGAGVMSLAEEKGALRAKVAAIRRAAFEAAGQGAGELFERRFLAAIPLPEEAVVAGYWPVGEEMEIRQLMRHLHDAGYVCALPMIAGRNRPLVFRAWRPGAALMPGAYGIPAPPADAPELRPDVVVVPLLAYDREGRRLGRGAGYYDRTLRALRAQAEVIAVGAAYAAQQVDSVPHDRSDERLDWVVTEQGAIRIERK